MQDPLDTGGPRLHAFVDQVQHRAGLDSSTEAERVARATLDVLSDAVSSGQAATLAAALPPELRSELSGRTSQANAFTKQAFLDRVGGQTSTVDLKTVEQHTRAVLTTLADWQPADHVDNTLAQLPPGITDLFTTTA